VIAKILVFNPSAPVIAVVSLADAVVRSLEVDVSEFGDSAAKRLVEIGRKADDRSQHLRRAGRRGVLAVRRGEVVLLSLIAPYATDRQCLRELIAEHGVYAEFYVATPLDECRRRDPKGLYRAAARGELTQLTGVDAPYEPPVSPNLVLDGRSAPDPQRVDAALRWILAARVGCGARP
jgi:adenylylsulfate kinase-like enzyme